MILVLTVIGRGDMEGNRESNFDNTYKHWAVHAGHVDLNGLNSTINVRPVS